MLLVLGSIPAILSPTLHKASTLGALGLEAMPSEDDDQDENVGFMAHGNNTGVTWWNNMR